MQPIQTQWGISEAPEGKQFKSYQNARNKCSEVAIQKLIKKKLGLLSKSKGGHETDGVRGEGGTAAAVENVQSIIEILAYFVFTSESAAFCELSNFVWALPLTRSSLINEDAPAQAGPRWRR